MKLHWNKLHLQSREEICLGACVSMRLADKSWAELEPWLQELLASSVAQRSSGRIELGIELGDDAAIRFPLRENESR